MGGSCSAQLDLDLKEPKNLCLAGGLAASSLNKSLWGKDRERGLDSPLSWAESLEGGCKQPGLGHPVVLFGG